jgi:pSer/pThr/pTyr-binding forkhead associated (FHA) protein/outer membrane biosynthesis protein TonB
VNIEKQKPSPLFELLPQGVQQGKNARPIRKKRMLLGSADACDIVLRGPGISAIHAVIEVMDEKCKIFDMNSQGGTFVNGKKVIASELKTNDSIKFGSIEFELRNFSEDEVLPLPLDMLSNDLPPVMEESKKTLPKSAPASVSKSRATATSQLPRKEGTASSKVKEEMPRVVYPLAQDPKAEFSEYIFEDVDTLYPIFDYSNMKQAVEVIILFNGEIFSVDYIPQKVGTYHLAGSNAGENDIEYAYLGKGDKVPFVEVVGHEVFVSPLSGYESICISDEKKKLDEASTVLLERDDIIRFSNGNLQIFVRGTDSPPKVAAAPILRRDGDLKKYMLLMLILIIPFLAIMSFVDVDEELEKEKVPERIATILYKRKKLVVSKRPPITKTKNKPKKVMQKSPSQKPVVKKKATSKPRKKVAKATKKTGSKSAKKTGLVKKASPNKARKTNKKLTKVTPRRKSTVGKKSRAKSVSSKRYTNRKSKGAVDTYKSFEFKSTISSLMAKGGSAKAAKAVDVSDYSAGETSLAAGGESATLKTAKVSKNVGSLVGAAAGKLDSSKGVQGLVGRKSIYTAGLPFKTVILGGMDPDLIRKILIDHIGQFRSCYQNVLTDAPKAFNGVVRLDFIIGASGQVTKAGVESASRAIPAQVKNCVVNVLYGIPFPAPKGGAVIEVNQPFNFYPKRK